MKSGGSELAPRAARRRRRGERYHVPEEEEETTGRQKASRHRVLGPWASDMITPALRSIFHYTHKLRLGRDTPQSTLRNAEARQRIGPLTDSLPRTHEAVVVARPLPVAESAKRDLRRQIGAPWGVGNVQRTESRPAAARASLRERAPRQPLAEVQRERAACHSPAQRARLGGAEGRGWGWGVGGSPDARRPCARRCLLCEASLRCRQAEKRSAFCQMRGTARNKG